ncbi:hypothetical protein D9M69_561800 [compost metagenome]
MAAPERQPQHVVAPRLAAGAQAARALDAGVEVHRHGRVRCVSTPPFGLSLSKPGRSVGAPFDRLRANGVCGAQGKAARLSAGQPSPVRQLAVVLERRGVGRVGQQQFQHRFLRRGGARAVGVDHHARLRRAAARGREHAFARHLDHAGAAVAGAAQAVLVAQVRDRDAHALRHFQNALARRGFHRLAVEREGDGRHVLG